MYKIDCFLKYFIRNNKCELKILSNYRFNKEFIRKSWHPFVLFYCRKNNRIFTSAYLTLASISAREIPDSELFEWSFFSTSIRALSSCNFKRSSSMSFSDFACSLSCDCLSSFIEKFIYRTE
jgi:hypothetical protein